MAKRKYTKRSKTADRQPTEVGELSVLVDEFMKRYENVENELELLKEDQKELIEEFSDRLDMKTLKQAIRTVKIKKKVDHKDTYDAFCDILDRRENV
jgi:uncharacterized protein (UPF0335 family)